MRHNSIFFLPAYSLYPYFILKLFFSQHVLYIHASYFNCFSLYPCFIIQYFFCRHILYIHASYFYDFPGGSWVSCVDSFLHQFTQTSPVIPRDVSSAGALWHRRPMDQGVGLLEVPQLLIHQVVCCCLYFIFRHCWPLFHEQETNIFLTFGDVILKYIKRWF